MEFLQLLKLLWFSCRGTKQHYTTYSSLNKYMSVLVILGRKCIRRPRRVLPPGELR